MEEEKQEESLAPAVEVDAEQGNVIDAVDVVPEEQGAATTASGKDDVDALVKAESSEEEEEEEDGKLNKQKKMMVAADAPWKDRMWEVFTTFWPLGLIAFGGPQAHVAILRDHLVVQRDWLDEEQFTELFAIGQVRTLIVIVIVGGDLCSFHYISWALHCIALHFASNEIVCESLSLNRISSLSH